MHTHLKQKTVWFNSSTLTATLATWFFFMITGTAFALTLSTDIDGSFDTGTEPEETLAMEFAPDIEPPKGGTELGNGIVVNRKDFPTLVKLTGKNCTGAIIGPRVILFAAHCISLDKVDETRVKFSLSAGSVRARCAQAPNYSAKESKHDWALCKTDRAFQDVVFETISDLKILPKKTKVVLTGFGCVLWGQKSDGKLRVGLSHVVSTPKGMKTADEIVYIKSDFDQGEAALCSGDSGGPAFLILGQKVNSARLIVSVNARSKFDLRIGALAFLGSASAQSFLKNWAATNQVEVCGITFDDPGKCR